jgi:hypothetical protein
MLHKISLWWINHWVPIVGECILLCMYQISIDNLRSQLYSSMLYYTRISRHVLANSKPSSGVAAYRYTCIIKHAGVQLRTKVVYTYLFGYQ